jgi:hypothetical protein
MFKRIAVCGLALVGLIVPLANGLGQTAAPAQPMAGQPAVSYVIQQDFRFITWEGTRGTNIFKPERGEGWQLYAPLIGGMVADFSGAARWELMARTGYVWSHHNTKGQEASYEGPVDTQLAAKVTLSGLPYISPFVGVVTNVPTGESFLPGQQRFGRMDPDLVELGAYGEGFNVNPLAGFTFALTPQFVLSPSIGYAWRGRFEREGGFISKIEDGKAQVVDLTGTGVETDPGDPLTASLTSVAKIGAWTVEGSLSYVSQSEVKQNGVPVGQAGAGYVANVAARYPVAPSFSIILNGSWKLNEKNKIPKTAPSVDLPFGGGDLIEEAKNSNSHVLIGAIQPTFALTEKLALGVNYSILWRDQNYYNIIEDRFIPARTKHSAGLVLDYAFSKQAVISLSGSRYWVQEGAGPVGTVVVEDREDKPPVTSREILPERSYMGWTGALTAKIRF